VTGDCAAADIRAKLVAMIVRGTAILGAMAAGAFVAAPAVACLPPLPGERVPSLEERVRSAFEHATDIVYGVVTKREDGRQRVRFKVLHVYKGDLAAGARLTLERGFGLDPPACVHMIAWPPMERGAYGVIVFRDSRPTLTFLAPAELELMFAKGWIARAPR
jgi:hypothetical protein